MDIRNFINRPIMSVMLSVIIVIIGLQNLPIEQYPDNGGRYFGYTGVSSDSILYI